MKLIELKKIIDFHIKEGCGDLKVVVSTEDNSFGPHACSEVILASPGFDWDSGKFNLSTEYKLIKLKDA